MGRAIIRIIVFWDLDLGPCLLRNYHVGDIHALFIIRRLPPNEHASIEGLWLRV